MALEAILARLEGVAGRLEACENRLVSSGGAPSQVTQAALSEATAALSLGGKVSKQTGVLFGSIVVAVFLAVSYSGDYKFSKAADTDRATRVRTSTLSCVWL